VNKLDECEQCGAGCDFKDQGGPCWGQVRVIDEIQCGTEEEPDWSWLHSCQGHEDLNDGGNYKAAPAGGAQEER
jgi:hypothetical protein